MDFAISIDLATLNPDLPNQLSLPLVFKRSVTQGLFADKLKTTCQYKGQTDLTLSQDIKGKLKLPE